MGDDGYEIKTLIGHCEIKIPFKSYNRGLTWEVFLLDIEQAEEFMMYQACLLYNGSISLKYILGLMSIP